MGNACCNEAQKKDEHDKKFGGVSGKPAKMDPKLNELLEEAAKHEKEVTKIQAGFRGMKARKDFKNNKKD